MEHHGTALEPQPFEDPQDEAIEVEGALALESWRLMQVVQRGLAEDATKDESDEASAAFALIYERYRPAVFSSAYSRVRDKTLAEDITSDVFARALRGAAKYEWQGKNLGAWLHVIAMNLIRDDAKSGYRRHVVLGPDDYANERVDQSSLGYPEDEVIKNLSVRELHDAMRRLTDEQRQALELRYMQEQSVEETARTMKKQEGAVKALALRAISTLGRILPNPNQDVPVKPIDASVVPVFASRVQPHIDRVEDGIAQIGSDFFAVVTDKRDIGSIVLKAPATPNAPPTYFSWNSKPFTHPLTAAAADETETWGASGDKG